MFEGKRVLVTGGSRGLGKDAALAFAREGARVAIVYTSNDAAANETARQLAAVGKSDPIVIKTDLTVEEQANQAVDQVVSAWDGVDILVNCHGLLMYKPLEEHSGADFRRVVAVNLFSAFYTATRVAPGMKERRWGRIINFSSMAGKSVAHGNVVAYSSAKAGVIGFTRALAHDLAPFGVTVNCVAPALIETEMLDALPPGRKEATILTVPVGRIGKPSETTHAVLFLAHENAGFVTGETVNVNGGRLMD